MATIYPHRTNRRFYALQRISYYLAVYSDSRILYATVNLDESRRCIQRWFPHLVVERRTENEFGLIITAPKCK